MRVTTLLQYLIGCRGAIQRVAHDRRSLLIGGMFVLSAGLAREYDAQDLVREPYWLLLPFAASIIVAFGLLVTLRYGLARRSRRPPTLVSGFSQILALVWMTAPMAWLYAIPYERFLSPAAAAEANVWTLALVAAWRLLLVSRALAVIGRVPMGITLPVVIFMGDLMLLAAMRFSPMPIIDFMGGVQMSERDRFLMNTMFLTQIFAILALPALFLAAMVAIVVARGNWRPPRPGDLPPPQGIGTLGPLAVLSVLVWAPILPSTQREQRLASRAEGLLKSGQLDAALRLMSSTPRDAFPPAWDPPPHLGYADDRPPLLDVMEWLTQTDVQGWAREIYLDKFERAHLKSYPAYYPKPAEWARVESLLVRLPEGRELAAEYRHALAERRSLLPRVSGDGGDETTGSAATLPAVAPGVGDSPGGL